MIEYAELKTVRPSAFALLPPARPLTILILARDEADVLGPTLAAIQRKMRMLNVVGHGYSEEEIAAAPAELEGKTELDAVVAYLQVLGIHAPKN